MKKTLLIAVAALFAAAQANADYYVIGNDVNGQNWALAAPDAKMTEKSSGVYEWNGQTLGSSFKINNGTWDDGAPNIGSNGSKIKLDVAYSYGEGSDTGDIAFDAFGTVTNPKVVLDTNAKTITLSGSAEATDPSDVTFYIIGSNVNGQSWALAAEDAKFESKGNGIYEWKGTMLGTGFKINDGTWSNGDYNIGSAGAEIAMNQPYNYWANGSSGNIAFQGFTELKDPVVELNINDETITLTSGTPDGEASWYVTGINGVYELNNDWILTQVGNTNVFQREVYVVETAGKVKISDDGWAHQYGTNDPEVNFINPDNLSVYLDKVDGEGGDVDYELEEGTYTVQFDLDELMLTFVSGSVGVETVVLGEGKAVYYNLQGQKVANPEKGIFVRVQNGKAVKVVK